MVLSITQDSVVQNRQYYQGSIKICIMYQVRGKYERDIFDDVIWLYLEGVGGCLIISKIYESCQGWILPADPITCYSWTLLYPYCTSMYVYWHLKVISLLNSIISPYTQPGDLFKFTQFLNSSYYYYLCR